MCNWGIIIIASRQHSHPPVCGLPLYVGYRSINSSCVIAMSLFSATLVVLSINVFCFLVLIFEDLPFVLHLRLLLNSARMLRPYHCTRYCLHYLLLYYCVQEFVFVHVQDGIYCTRHLRLYVMHIEVFYKWHLSSVLLSHTERR